MLSFFIFTEAWFYLMSALASDSVDLDNFLKMIDLLYVLHV